LFLKSLKSISCRDYDEEEAFAPKSSMTVFPETCMSKPCNESCEAAACDVCWNCLSADQKFDRRRAYVNFYNQGEFTRIIPPSNVMRIVNRLHFHQQFTPQEFMKNAGDDYWNSLTPANRRQSQWMMGMCLKMKRYC